MTTITQLIALVARRLILPGLLCFTAGCATSGGAKFTQLEAPDPQKATVYFYRPGKESWNVKGRKFHIYVNAQRRGKLAYGTYCRRTLPPGEVTILADSAKNYFQGLLAVGIEEATKKPGVVSTDLAPGSISFIKLRAVDKFWSIGGELSQEERETALKELPQTKRVEWKD